MPRIRPSVLLVALAMLLGLLLTQALAGWLAERRALLARAQEGRGQLALYAQALHIQVERFRSVPALLALDDEIRALLADPQDAARRQQVNARLERQNQAAGSSVLYLLDTRGTALAASNWREWSSFVGNNYGFRPYFRDALRDGAGRYFAVGVTTGVPGYFLSQAVTDADGRTLGVLVVKLELEEMQRDWAGQPGVLLVADSLDVVILATRPAWRFRTLRALPADSRERLVSARRYAEQPLQPLPSEPLARLDAHTELRRVQGPDGTQRYLWQSLALPDERWTLHLLEDPRSVAPAVASQRLAAAGAWLALCFLGLFLAQRRKLHRLEQHARGELERLVAQRTDELRQAQDELLHAARMAALGQMSAALAHEVNQPLTALRMQLGSLRLLLEQGRQDDIRAGLEQADGLIQRMAALTAHLKTFARKQEAGRPERLDPVGVLDQALLLLTPRLHQERVRIHRQVQDGIEVMGEAIRLEQVLVNLLHNAVDAMAGRAEPRIAVRVWQDDGRCCIAVADNGPGIRAEALDRLFEPFFTTKPVGQGLGLGLAVSYGIVRDLGGSLEAGHGADGGAVFTLRLPVAGAAA